MTSTPLERFLDALYATTGERARYTGKELSLQCPAHSDRRPSLSLSEGDDGRVLVHCHAGCTVESICSAVGLRVVDLMADSALSVSTSTEMQKSPGKRHYRRRRQPQTHKTARDAVAELERKHGSRSGLWTYRDGDGKPVGVIVRWDKHGGKTIRPVAKVGDVWTIGGMAEPRPLYNLPDLLDANRVYICEGEKAADAARSLGLIATTSAHGSRSPQKTDWSPLAGKECVILPDNDEPGREYAHTVAAILANLRPAPVIKIVELSNLPDRGDIVDWIDSHGDAAEPAELRRQVEILGDEAEAIRHDRCVARVERYQPFPTDVLPDPIGRFVKAVAKAIGCDPSYVALPLLTVLGAAIGNTRRIRLKHGWNAPPIIWTAIVGESGTAKTPAFRFAMRAVRDLQGRVLEAHADAQKAYENNFAHYEKALAAWKRDGKTTDDPPEKPAPPAAVRYVVSDTTVEALAVILLENPRGVLLARDELAGWIGSFDRYAGGKGGSDAAHWLSMHNGESFVVDRKTGHPRTIVVPQASVCVTGGIQPATLRRVLSSQHRESGLAARILVACPPRQAKRWTEADVYPKLEKQLASVIGRLYGLTQTIDGEGNICPLVLDLTPAAKQAWTDFYNRHAEEQAELSGDLSAAWSKLEEYAARFALVIYCVRVAAGDPTLAGPHEVDEMSMSAGIRLTRWFKNEARRVYALLAESDDERDQRRLIEWVERKGGSVTAREVQQGIRQYSTAVEAEAALESLVENEYGSWVLTPSGQRGQPTRRFVLSTMSTVYGNSAEPEEDSNTVDVDSVDAPNTPSNDEWGEL